jgi:hypothetical protein
MTLQSEIKNIYRVKPHDKEKRNQVLSNQNLQLQDLIVRLFWDQGEKATNFSATRMQLLTNMKKEKVW